ncbi:hypothetical protein M885DRAFT_509693 [Pelagophyceae sp. CCMP2097]|nr:hypothetical protein M885DRAFT_509693 [Pelagophyceae sp. CCMP2097]
MFQRLEDRAKDWITTKLREGEDADDLTGLPASRDPLLGTTASIGFSFFGVGWQISICVKCYLSRLRRWRCRAWELRVGADDWRDLFFDVAALGREEVGERSVVPNAKMPEDKPKDETIFVSGAALKKALETTPLFNDCFGGTPPSTDALRRAWHLCDLGRDDGLGRDEFALFVYLLRRLLVDNVKLPAYLASDLFPPRTKPRDASAPQETPPDTPPKAARKSPKPAETVDV